MLARHTGKPITEIPQIFVPYKETMDIYEYGLKVPDDITIVWVDDNYGYFKKVSNRYYYAERIGYELAFWMRVEGSGAGVHGRRQRRI